MTLTTLPPTLVRITKSILINPVGVTALLALGIGAKLALDAKFRERLGLAIEVMQNREEL